MDNKATGPATDQSDVFKSIFNYTSNPVEKAASVSAPLNERKRRRPDHAEDTTAPPFENHGEMQGADNESYASSSPDAPFPGLDFVIDQAQEKRFKEWEKKREDQRHSSPNTRRHHSEQESSSTRTATNSKLMNRATRSTSVYANYVEGMDDDAIFLPLMHNDLVGHDVANRQELTDEISISVNPFRHNSNNVQPSTPAADSVSTGAVFTFHIGEHVFARQSDGNYHPAIIVNTSEVPLSNGSSYSTYSCGFIESVDQLLNLDLLVKNLRSSDLIKTSLIAANDHVHVKSSWSNRTRKFQTGKLISLTASKNTASGDQYSSFPDFCVQFIESGNLQVHKVTFDRIVIPKIQETNSWSQKTGKRTSKPTFKASPSSSSSPRSKSR